MSAQQPSPLTKNLPNNDATLVSWPLQPTSCVGGSIRAPLGRMERKFKVPAHMAKANEFLLDHPFAAWLIWFLFYSTLTRAISVAAPPREAPNFGWAAWVFLVMAAYTAVVAVLLEKVLRSNGRGILSVRWSLAQSPVLLAFAAVLLHAPQWLFSVALAETIALMVFAQRRARAPARGHNHEGTGMA